jgi:hypothetical protein
MIGLNIFRAPKIILGCDRNRPHPEINFLDRGYRMGAAIPDAFRNYCMGMTTAFNYSPVFSFEIS